MDDADVAILHHERMSMTETAIRAAARTVEAAKTYGSGDATVRALQAVTVEFPEETSR